ncbi:hypothetical protein KDD30_17125 (plasmid) [Photobacterium sp. GJ3]|uniref:hypothetical protein n=1 Tax=Photobacterium sp. GJ3 TaxID=2829502 RepID=UPI001B8BA72C|nr:hypothetical protein [Photobacterium sp. GJ3]QUJ69894.1 hypothetical protein KDD30_17125 [Photobacterium sp. GJ3]
MISEDHVYASKIGNKILKIMLITTAILMIPAVFIIGSSALVGFGGLGVTWLVLSQTNLDKYLLSQRISTHNDIFFLREHDDHDEPRDYFLIYHRSYIYKECEDGSIVLDKYKFTSTDIFCHPGRKGDLMNKFQELFPYGTIPYDKKDLFKGAVRFLPPQEIMDLEAQTSPYGDEMEKISQ